jgi:hypothetical protein
MSHHSSLYNIVWRVSNIVQIPIGLTFICLSFFYRESPRWLLEKYPETLERTLSTLVKIRSGTPNDGYVSLEFHELVASHEYHKRFKARYRGLLSSAGMRNRFGYGVYAMDL